MTSTLKRVRYSFIAEGTQSGPLYRYGMLFLCGTLLLWHVCWLQQLPAAYPFQYQRTEGFIVPSMLLLNHFAYSFCWPERIRVSLRVAAWAGILLVFWWLFFRSGAVSMR